MRRQLDWSSFNQKWPVWRLCLSAVFFCFVTWAVIANHPVKWFVIPAAPLAVVLGNDVRKVLRGGATDA